MQAFLEGALNLYIYMEHPVHWNGIKMAIFQGIYREKISVREIYIFPVKDPIWFGCKDQETVGVPSVSTQKGNNRDTCCMSQCFERVRLISGRKCFCISICEANEAKQKKDMISLLRLPGKIQNDTNTSIEWDILLVNFICCWSEIQIELDALHFHLLNLAALLTARICRAPVSLVLPIVLGRDSRGHVCGDGKGQTVLGSLTGTMEGPPRRPVAEGWKVPPV